MRHASYVVLLLAPFASGCVSAPPPAPATVTAAHPRVLDGVRERGPFVDPGAATSMAAADPGLVRVPSASLATTEPIDDEKILQIAHVANEAEIEAAKLAEVRAVDEGVKALARALVMDHRKAERENEEVARLNQLEPQTSNLSSKLQADQHDALLQLDRRQGADFDRAFIDQQILTHREVLSLIDHRLLPAATTDEVQALMQRFRPDIVRRYDQARALQQKLGKE